MPKGKRKKRTEEEYEKEIEEATKRMQKYPEHLRSARDNEAWKEFLTNIGVTTGKADFWQNVRDTIYIKEVGFTPAQLGVNIEIVTGVYRDKKGKFTSKADGNKPVVSLRDKTTGRFTSKKSIK